MHDHLCAKLRRGVIFSALPGTLELTTLGSLLEEPASKRVRTESTADREDRLEIDIEAEERLPEPLCFFELTWLNLGKKKTVPVALGAGGQGSMKEIEAAVHIFSNVNETSDGIVLTGSAQAAEANFVLRGIHPQASCDKLITDTKIWDTSGRWTPQPFRHADPAAPGSNHFQYQCFREPEPKRSACDAYTEKRMKANPRSKS